MTSLRRPVNAQLAPSASPSLALRPAPSLRLGFAGFASLVGKTVHSRLTYRVAVLVSLLANATAYSLVLVVWAEVYRGGDAGLLLPQAALFPYLVLAFVLNFALTLNVEIRFGSRMRMGLIASDLVKPLGFMPMQLAQGVGDALSNLLLALPILVVGFGFLGAPLLPPSASAAALGVFGMFFGLLVSFSIGYLLVQASFVTQSFYGIFFTRVALHQAFSGLSAPLVLFPEPLRRAAELLPFRHVIETPIALWLGWVEGRAALLLLGQQLLWALLLLGLSMFSFRVALRRHQLQGG